MSIRKKIENLDFTQNFTSRLESTLFDLLNDDSPINIYMLTDLCKILNTDIEIHFPTTYISGSYNLKTLSNGDINKVLDVTEALYETCIRFEKFELAVIVNSEVTRSLADIKIPLQWVDGKFLNLSLYQ